MYLRSGFYESCCSSLMIRVQHNHLLWLRGKNSNLRTFSSPRIKREWFGVPSLRSLLLAFWHALMPLVVSGLSAPFFPITPFIVEIIVAALIFHFAPATLCPCGPLLIWSIFNDRLSAPFFSLVYTDRHLTFSCLPVASCAWSFSISDAINVFCLPFVGQFIIYLLFIFCPQSLLLPSYRLPVFVVHFYVSSILSFVMIHAKFPFVLIHMGTIVHHPYLLFLALIY